MKKEKELRNEDNSRGRLAAVRPVVAESQLSSL